MAKVLELETLDETFDYPAGFDLAAHWRARLHRFEAGLRKGEATLRVSAAALSRLDRLGADIADAVLRMQPEPGGWRQAVVPIESVDHAASLLLGFADDIEVLAPPALRRQLAARARRVAAMYRTAPAYQLETTEVPKPGTQGQKMP